MIAAKFKSFNRDPQGSAEGLPAPCRALPCGSRLNDGGRTAARRLSHERTDRHLPSGWACVTLGDVTSTSKERVEPSDCGDSPYVGLEHIEAGRNRIIRYGKADDVKSTKSIFHRGDVLYGKLRPYLRKVCRPDFDGVCSTDILVFPESFAVDNGYLLHFLSLQSTADFATQNANGINLPRVSAGTLGELELPLAPLREQRRMVAKIEALQERTREALAEVGPLLEQFRQSVLAAAFRGDLTADWRAAHPDVEPASELLARIRAERRRRWEEAELAKYEAAGKKRPKNLRAKYPEPEAVEDSDLHDVPHGWTWSSVEEICTAIVDCPHSTPKWTRDGKLCLRTTEFRPGSLDLSDARFVSEATFKERICRLRPQAGDVLYSREGGILGISCQVPQGTELCLGQRMMLMRPIEQFASALLMHWLNSPQILERLERLISGSASPHLNVGEVRRFPVPVPPVDEQREVLRTVNECFSIPTSSRTIAEQFERELGQLDQSILAKAFRGELVPQDPNDEPASVLLERIRSAGAAAANDGKPRRAKSGKPRAGSRTVEAIGS